MRRFVSVCLILLILPCFSLAQERESEFDARLLTVDEKRYLQAALIFEGTYVGLLDGQWGQGSQTALMHYAGRRSSDDVVRNRDLVPLLSAFGAELLSAGWRVLYSDATDQSYLVPISLVEIDKSTEHPTLQTPDGSLLIRALAEFPQKSFEMHDWLRANHAGPAEIYQSYRESRWITSAQLRGGKFAYLRSSRLKTFIISILVQYEPWQKRRGQLIVSSIQRGNQRELFLSPGGFWPR